jgi:dihydroneopterin aldolase
MDQIIIEELQVYYCVGVPDEERGWPQRMLVSVVLECDFTRAAATEDVTQTIDYAAVSKRLITLGAGRSWKLLETLAVEIAETLLREFKPARVSVEIKKFILCEARHVAVRVTRPARA